jgi:tetratricopeptide (TPR) repeat protein
MFARYLLAGELQGNQRYAEAAAELRQLIAIQKRALGPHHQNVANTRMNLGVVYSAMKMHAEAEAEYRLSLAFYQHRANPSAYDREEAARLSRHLASSLQNQGRYKEAEVLKEQANALSPIHVGVPAKRMPLPPIPAPSRLVK